MISATTINKQNLEHKLAFGSVLTKATSFIVIYCFLIICYVFMVFCAIPLLNYGQKFLPSFLSLDMRTHVNVLFPLILLPAFVKIFPLIFRTHLES